MNRLGHCATSTSSVASSPPRSWSPTSTPRGSRTAPCPPIPDAPGRSQWARPPALRLPGHELSLANERRCLKCRTLLPSRPLPLAGHERRKSLPGAGCHERPGWPTPRSWKVSANPWRPTAGGATSSLKTPECAD